MFKYNYFSIETENELLPYSSFEEAVQECVFCCDSADDVVGLGRKKTMEDITAHHFCLVSLVFNNFLNCSHSIFIIFRC